MQKGISTLIGIIIIIVVAIVAFGGVFAYKYFAPKTQPIVQPQQVQNKIVKPNEQGQSSEKISQFNGFVVQGAAKEYQYTSAKHSLELEILLDYVQIGNDYYGLTVFDPNGRYIGEDFGGSLTELQNKSKIPDAEYNKKTSPPQRIFIENPMSGAYTIKVWGVVVSENVNNTGSFNILINEFLKSTD